jgi:nucleoid-associated protein YgaU
LFTLFDVPVTYGVPATAEGTLTVDADNPSGLPENDFRVIVPLTFGRPLLGSAYAGFSQHHVVDGDTLFGIAQNSYSDGNLWPRLFTANRDRIGDPDLIQVGQVLRIPFEGP